MATCAACDAEIEATEVEIGETIACSECGAEMEVVGVHPLELECIEEEEEEDLEEMDDSDEDEEEEEEY